jgi:hypothetical protein
VKTTTLRTQILAAVLVACPAALTAQLPLSSTRALGMGGSFGAAARGYEAIAWNPALLGLSDRPGFSLNLIQVSGELGDNAFNYADFQNYKDKALTRADKDTIMAKVLNCPNNAVGPQCGPARPLSMRLGAGLTSIAMTFGNFGLSLSGGGSADASLSSDFVELAMYGNVTRKGAGQKYLGAGTAANALGTGTLAVAYGSRLPVPTGQLAIGATVKFTDGVALGRFEDAGTSLQTSPNFQSVIGGQALFTDVSKNVSNGSGVGLDVGGVYELASGLRFGLQIENLISVMSWKDDNLKYSRKIFALTQNGDQFSDSTIADDSVIAYNPANPAQKAMHDSLFTTGTFPTRVRGSVAMHSGMLTLVGGIDFRVKDGVVGSDPQIASVGAELLPLGILALRAGLATNFQGGSTLAVGGGLKLGPIRMDLGLSSTSSGDRKGFQAAGGFSLMN